MSEEKIKCPKCGTESNIDDVYCKECGKDLTKKEKVTNFKKPFSTVETFSYIISFSLLAFVLGFLACVKFSMTLDQYSGNSENILQQIYNVVTVVGYTVSACIGIVISFAIILFVRVNKKLNDIYVQIGKINENRE